MAKLGVMEIFFGSPWAPAARLSYAEFLADHGFASYLYGPKGDTYLRRQWREEWPAEYLAGLKALSRHFRAYGLDFGLCFSPMDYNPSEHELLRRKISILNEVGLNTFGLFFDDMPVQDDLAQLQASVFEHVQSETDAKILFCPSYYSTDPLLDRVFGARPPQYLETLGAALPPGVEIAWTGPKVISPEIPAAHLAEVETLLGRAPSICDNFFANDGPKNCQFLKLKHLSGRPAESFARTSSWYFNPMNQAELSKPLLRAAAGVLREGQDPVAAWAESLAALCSPALADLLLRYEQEFREVGLGNLSESPRAHFAALAEKEPIAAEVCAWLDGAYTVGSECLTD